MSGVGFLLAFAFFFFHKTKKTKSQEMKISNHWLCITAKKPAWLTVIIIHWLTPYVNTCVGFILYIKNKKNKKANEKYCYNIKIKQSCIWDNPCNKYYISAHLQAWNWSELIWVNCLLKNSKALIYLYSQLAQWLFTRENKEKLFTKAKNTGYSKAAGKKGARRQKKQASSLQPATLRELLCGLLGLLFVEEVQLLSSSCEWAKMPSLGCEWTD